MSFLHRAEANIVKAALGLLAALSPATASNLGGAVARAIGPLLPVSRVADDNLRRAMPDLDAAARRRVIRGVWDNLGRTMGELPHVASLRITPSGPGFELSADDFDRARAVASAGGPAILFSGHLGNWEIWPALARCFGVTPALVYRPAANQAVDAMLRRMRGASTPMFAKGAEGARGMMKHLAGGGYLAMLVDQKMNDGIAVDFFGRPAWTAPAIAALALKYRCSVHPAHAERIGPARFRVHVEAPLALPQSPDRTANIALFMRGINEILEGWIREKPDSWLWLHRRWPRDQ